MIRSRTGNRKSLDEFARAFFGIDDGKWEHPNHYRFEDVVEVLNNVHAHDWTRFLRDRLDGRTVSIDYRDGLRYPALERIKGKPDYLTPILNARK